MHAETIEPGAPGHVFDEQAEKHRRTGLKPRRYRFANRTRHGRR